MAASYRIALAVDDRTTKSTVISNLSAAGHHIVADAPNAEELARVAAGADIELLVAECDGGRCQRAAAMRQLSEKLNAPVVAILGPADMKDFDHTQLDRVFASVVMPVRESDLTAAVRLAMERYREYCACRDEAAALKRALEDRKLVERAKGIIMQQRSASENDALVHIQQLARRHRLKMAEVAKSIILAHDTIGGPLGADRAARQFSTRPN